MNKVELIGRLVRDPEIRQTDSGLKTGRYSLAVSKKGGNGVDYINCVAFGKNAEFVERFLRKGMKMAVTGSILTGKYTNREGKTIYTVEVNVDEHEFCESKSSSAQAAPQTQGKSVDDFVDIPKTSSFDEVPFS